MTRLGFELPQPLVLVAMSISFTLAADKKRKEKKIQIKTIGNRNLSETTFRIKPSTIAKGDLRFQRTINEYLGNGDG